MALTLILVNEQTATAWDVSAWAGDLAVIAEKIDASGVASTQDLPLRSWSALAGTLPVAPANGMVAVFGNATAFPGNPDPWDYLFVGRIAILPITDRADGLGYTLRCTDFSRELAMPIPRISFNGVDHPTDAARVAALFAATPMLATWDATSLVAGPFVTYAADNVVTYRGQIGSILAQIAADPGGDPAVATTLGVPIGGAGSWTVTPPSMIGIRVGRALLIDVGGAAETVVVTALTALSFTATYTLAHLAAAPVASPAVVGTAAPRRTYVSAAWTDPTHYGAGVTRLINYYAATGLPLDPVPLTDAPDGQADYVADGFGRAVSSTTLGVADTGQPWSALAGGWGTDGDHAYLPSGGADNLAIQEATLADCRVTGTLVTVATDVGLGFRAAADGGNIWAGWLWVAQASFSRYVLFKRQAGGYFLIGTLALPPANGDGLRVTLAGASILCEVLRSGIAVGSVATSDSFQQGATWHGLVAVSAQPSARWDDFHVRGPGTIYRTGWIDTEDGSAPALSNLLMIEGPSTQPVPVTWETVWTPPVGVTTAPGAVQKTLLTNAWDAGASTVQQLASEGGEVIWSTEERLIGQDTFTRVDSAQFIGGLETDQDWRRLNGLYHWGIQSQRAMCAAVDAISARLPATDAFTRANNPSALGVAPTGQVWAEFHAHGAVFGIDTNQARAFPISASDTFTRANNPSTLGNAETGQAWTVDNPAYVFGISSNQAYPATLGSSGTGIAVLDTGLADAIVEVTLRTLVLNSSRVVVRASDENTHLLVQPEAGSPNRYALYQRVLGTLTLLVAGGPVPSSGDTVRIVLVADAIDVYINGVLQLQAHSTVNEFATLHGIGITSSGGAARWDNFIISANGPSIAVIDALYPNIAVAAVFAALELDAQQLVARATDEQNCLFVTPHTGAWQLWKRVAGVETLLGSAAATPTAGDTVQLLCVGNAVQIWAYGVCLLAVTETFNQAATRHGLGYRFQPGGSGAARWDTFAIGAAETSGLVVADLGASSGILQVTLAAGVGDGSRLAFRVADENNHWYVHPASGHYALVRRRAGVETVRGTGGPTPAAGDVVKVSLEDALIEVYVNGSFAFSATDSFQEDLTTHGLSTTRAGAPTVRWDTFSFAQLYATRTLGLRTGPSGGDQLATDHFARPAPGGAPAVATILGTAVAGAGVATVTPPSMIGITVGRALAVDTGGATETVVVTAVSAGTFTATFTAAHLSGAPVTAAAGVSLGIADSGQAWTLLTGSGFVFGIDSGQARCYTSGASGTGLAVIETHQATVIVEAQLAALELDAQQVCARVTDASNYLYVTPHAGAYQLWKRVAGSNTLLATSPRPPVAGDVVRLQAIGSALTVFVNGTAILAAVDAFNAGATQHGIGYAYLLANTGAARWSSVAILGTRQAPDFGIVFGVDRTAQVIEGGIRQGSARTYAAGDFWRIAVTFPSSTHYVVSYAYRPAGVPDWVPWGTSSVAPDMQLHSYQTDVALYHAGSGFTNITAEQYGANVFSDPVSLAAFGPWPAPSVINDPTLDTYTKRASAALAYFSQNSGVRKTYDLTTTRRYRVGTAVLFNSQRLGIVNARKAVITVQVDRTGRNREFWLYAIQLDNAPRLYGVRDPLRFTSGGADGLTTPGVPVGLHQTGPGTPDPDNQHSTVPLAWAAPGSDVQDIELWAQQVGNINNAVHARLPAGGQAGTIDLALATPYLLQARYWPYAGAPGGWCSPVTVIGGAPALPDPPTLGAVSVCQKQTNGLYFATMPLTAPDTGQPSEYMLQIATPGQLGRQEYFDGSSLKVLAQNLTGGLPYTFTAYAIQQPGNWRSGPSDPIRFTPPRGGPPPVSGTGDSGRPIAGWTPSPDSVGVPQVTPDASTVYKSTGGTWAVAAGAGPAAVPVVAGGVPVVAGGVPVVATPLPSAPITLTMDPQAVQAGQLISMALGYLRNSEPIASVTVTWQWYDGPAGSGTNVHTDTDTLAAATTAWQEYTMTRPGPGTVQSLIIIIAVALGSALAAVSLDNFVPPAPAAVSAQLAPSAGLTFYHPLTGAALNTITIDPTHGGATFASSNPGSSSDTPLVGTSSAGAGVTGITDSGTGMSGIAQTGGNGMQAKALGSGAGVLAHSVGGSGAIVQAGGGSTNSAAAETLQSLSGHTGDKLDLLDPFGAVQGKILNDGTFQPAGYNAPDGSAGLTTTITLAKITVGGTAGSITIKAGIVTAYVPPT